VYQEAIQLLRLAKLGHPVSTQRLLVEKDALRVHMQCIEVLVGPDTFTVCKKMFNIENIQLPVALLKGIVLAEGCGSCQLVVHSLNCRGSVLTLPVKEPEHIAAYLVLALHYTGLSSCGCWRGGTTTRQGCSCTPTHCTRSRRRFLRRKCHSAHVDVHV
jgi:hypothetical protein